jgi:hypothetical protein
LKTPNWNNCTEEDVWHFVGWHLAKNGIQTVLVGGAVAAIYSDGIYKSGDLDLVLKTYFDGKITEIMESIDFKNQLDVIIFILIVINLSNLCLVLLALVMTQK